MQRAAFIWTADQPIREEAARTVFQQPRRVDGVNRWFLFRRVFDLPQQPTAARIRMTVDGRYRLFVNRQPIGRGPARCQPLLQRYDEYDLTAQLRLGINIIGLIVHVYGVDTAWYETVKGHWNPVFGDGGVWLDGFAQYGAERIALQTDLDWRCLECDAWERNTPTSNKGLDFIECFDARRFPSDWLEADFAARDWCAVQLMQRGGGGPEAFLSGMSVRPFPVLEPRGIPHLSEVEVPPVRIAWVRTVERRADLPVERRIHAEAFLSQARPVVAPAEMRFPLLMKTESGCGVATQLIFERVHAGYAFIEIEAKGGELIDIACAELLPDSDGRIVLDREMGLGAHVTRYFARPGVQRFERFEWQAVRTLQINVHDAEGGIEILSAGCIESRYPVRQRGEFFCNDPTLERLWQLGATTVHICMQDGWIDCPGRERRQWLGDATVESAVANVAFGIDSHALNAKFLVDAACSQRADGLLQMFAPGDHGGHCVTIPDWSLQWILNAHAHWRWTADVATLIRILPAMERVLQWFTAQLDPNGLLADTPYWHFMDWAGLGREGEAGALNAQLAGALDAAAAISRALGNGGSAGRFASAATGIRAALAQRHWDDARGVYVDSVDPYSGRQHPRISQHTNAAMILWGGAPRERWARMLDTITDPARAKRTRSPPIVPEGEAFDERSEVVATNTFYSHFLGAALTRAGRVESLLNMLRSRYGRMLQEGATTLWETSEGTGSACHGFSATPTYQLSTALLGLSPAEAGCAVMRWDPALGPLQFARGRLSTVRGDLCVEIERRPGGLFAIIDVPAGIRIQPAFGIDQLGQGRHDALIPDPARR